MKTTIEVADGLLEEAKALAKKEGITLRELFEDGLRDVLKRRNAPKQRVRLKDCSFGGEGLQVPNDWTVIRDEIYKGHGA